MLDTENLNPKKRDCNVSPHLMNLKDFVKYTNKDISEFHEVRHKAIMKKYGKEIKKLAGPTWWTKWYVLFLVVVQLWLSTWIIHQSWLVYLMVSWWIGGTVTACLTISLHEITHFTAFKSHKLNWLLAFVADIPIPVASAATFKLYHMDHHGYLGVDKYDPDVPTQWEAKLYSTKIGKFLQVMFNAFSYTLRPLLACGWKSNTYVIYNWVFQLSFNIIWINLFGWKPMLYLLFCIFLGMGWNPWGLSGHYISEHYLTQPGQETYSYYGPLNWISFNVGYHVEHHDFQNISCGKLPELRKIAPEFYNDRYHYTSWWKVLIDYVFTDGYSGYNHFGANIKDDVLKYRNGYGFKENWSGEARNDDLEVIGSRASLEKQNKDATEKQGSKKDD